MTEPFDDPDRIAYRLSMQIGDTIQWCRRCRMGDWRAERPTRRSPRNGDDRLRSAGRGRLTHHDTSSDTEEGQDLE